MDYHGLLNIAVEVGYSILENGAEIYRVEESVQRIIKAYGVKNAEVFAIPSCIIASICNDDGTSITKIKRIHSRGTNLDKVEKLNNLCRYICSDHPDFDTITNRLKIINSSPIYSFKIQIFAAAFTAFFFTLFFSGGLKDAFSAFMIGMLMRVATHAMERLKTNVFFINIVGSGITAVLAVLMVKLGIGNDMNKIIIGTLMNLVPGVAITNSIRDIIAGDLVAGLTKLTEAVLIATAMAVGAGIGLSVMHMM